MSNIPETFGCNVFSEKVMKERLSEDTYNALIETIKNGKPMSEAVAKETANAMKDWAIEKGVTHYTHWFQPMTGVTAEKHDSFIAPDGKGNAIMEFSGKELIKGEPDASSFPSGGIRATFEARGYTAWDPTAYAFIKDDTLCIPTVFLAYGGEALDKKTPLLRSMQAINIQAMRIIKLFGNTTAKRVITTVGPEQEYFLIDKKLFNKRKDLIYCGRTLFGAKPPKGQELDDHYFGKIKPRVAEFMKDLDEELWKLGVYAKTKHNEAAPAQHELAPIFTETNIATDHNQLTMERMQVVADRHGMKCLLAEKPFAGVNGSGKHNNWSISTDTGENLLNPGKTPHENAQFLLFLSAVIQAVDEHQDLLRISASSAGNDHRLGAHEAPPAIVSMFIGDDLEEVLNAIEADTPYSDKEKEVMKLGVNVLPRFAKDKTDRNRTSPFAFTGNKFEFRMLGSSASIACTNVMLNTIVADVLEKYADELEKAEDFNEAVHQLVKRVYKNHKRIIFNGNNYSEEWVAEAERRGLLNLKTTVDALELYTRPENIELFKHHGIYTEKEVRSRRDILLEEYSKTVNIEALTMVDLVRKDFIPAVMDYTKKLADLINSKKAVSKHIPCKTEISLLETQAAQCDEMFVRVKELEGALKTVPYTTPLETAQYYKNKIVPDMEALRAIVDEIEVNCDREFWPMPSYGDVIFSVQ